MTKIAIIQPAIPRYRIPFFSELANNYDLTLFSTSIDFLGVTTPSAATSVRCKLKLSGGFLKLFNKFYWHRNLPIFEILKEHSVIVVNGNPRVINYMLLVILGFFFQRKIVWWGHGRTAGSFGFSFKLRRLLMFLPSAILLYADEEIEYFSGAVFALNNGLDSADINRVKVQKSYRYLSDSPTPSILFIGRLTEKAKFSLLIKALEGLRGSYKLHVIGAISSLDKEKFFLNQPGMLSRVVLHGEVNDEEGLCDIFALCNVFVYPGAVGLSLIHVFNYGLPAIIHDDILHHMPEAHAHRSGVNGLTFRMNDSDSLRDAIERFSELTKLQKEEFAVCASRTVRDRFNVAGMVKNFDLCIDSLV